jgi:GMP synthase (glutamine-hydrolysing)
MEGNPVESRARVFGVQDVTLSAEGRRHWFFDGVGETLRIYQHHGDHVLGVDSNAVVLASSPTCPVEAVGWADNSVSVQFHPEVLQHQFVEALRKYPEQLKQSGLTLEQMLARIPDDYTRQVNCMFDNFLIRAGVTRTRLA